MRFNKRGDERILYFYWFFLFVVVAVAIVIGVGVFYGHKIDVRQVESELLVDKVVDCLVDGGKIGEKIEDRFFENFSEDFKHYCRFDFSDKNYDDEQYFVLIDVYDLTDCDDGCDNELLKIKEGNDFYFQSCDFEHNDKNLPQCVNKAVYTLIKDREIVLNITAGVGKVIQNV